ncbi:MAG: HAD family phosphatase [Lachnospiraceae bacterium]|nr:HAD family phosphatase [Lachnospiraceae bacterium]
MMTGKEYKAVVFDMDGVIFDSENCILQCWLELAKKYGIEDIEKNFRACTGTTAAKTREIMLEAYGVDFPYDAFTKEASWAFHEKYDDGRLPVKVGVEELLKYLKNEGKIIALASSTRKQAVERELEDAGLLCYFDALVTGDMVTKSKPDPEIYLLACERIGVNPEDAYAIEDSYNGIRSAQAGGLRPIMVPDLLDPNEEMIGLSEVVLNNLLEVKTYLTGE